MIRKPYRPRYDFMWRLLLIFAAIATWVFWFGIPFTDAPHLIDIQSVSHLINYVLRR